MNGRTFELFAVVILFVAIVIAAQSVRFDSNARDTPTVRARELVTTDDCYALGYWIGAQPDYYVMCGQVDIVRFAARYNDRQISEDNPLWDCRIMGNRECGIAMASRP